MTDNLRDDPKVLCELCKSDYVHQHYQPADDNDIKMGTIMASFRSGNVPPCSYGQSKNTLACHYFAFMYTQCMFGMACAVNIASLLLFLLIDSHKVN